MLEPEASSPPIHLYTSIVIHVLHTQYSMILLFDSHLLHSFFFLAFFVETVVYSAG